MPTTTTRAANTLLLALDLGNTTWKLGFPSKRNGMSQGELERRSRVSYLTINAIRSANPSPGEPRWNALCRVRLRRRDDPPSYDQIYDQTPIPRRIYEYF